MIPMTMTKEEEERLIILNHPNAQFTNTGACIENNVVSVV
jgi:hypothetical protein